MLNLKSFEASIPSQKYKSKLKRIEIRMNTNGQQQFRL